MQPHAGSRFTSPRRHDACEAPSAHAFTLVELLVVIGIIAVLIGILMPALSAARRSAVLTQCMAVQRQIGTAAQMHAQQHRGYFPVAGELSGVLYGQPAELQDSNKQKHKYLWIEAIGSTPWNRFTIAPWHAAVASYMGKRQVLEGVNNDEIIEDEIGIRDYLKYFICPADVTKSAEAEVHVIYTTTSGMYWTLQQSYLVNEAVFGVNDALGRLRGQSSRIKRPSQTVMMAEGKAAAHNGNPYSKWITIANYAKLSDSLPSITLADALEGNGNAGSPDNFDRFRHKDKINLLFFDGHCETRRIEAGDLTDVYLLTAN